MPSPIDRACFSLQDYLRTHGVTASVSYDNASGDLAKLFVDVSSGDASHVPIKWEGFSVVSVSPEP